MAQCQHTMEARRATHHFSLFNPLRGAQKKRLTKKRAVGVGEERKEGSKGRSCELFALLQAGLNEMGFFQDIYTVWQFKCGCSVRPVQRMPGTFLDKNNVITAVK